MGEIINIEILGNKMDIETTMKKEDAEKVISYVHNLMKEIKDKNPFIPYTSIATIAALNIAEELFTILSKLKELDNMI